MTARTLRAFARRPPAARSIVTSAQRAAACATCPAGRACRCLGRTTVRSAASSANWRASELADITCLLCGHGDGGEVEATTGGDSGAVGDENNAYHVCVSCSAVPNVDRFFEGLL